MIREPRARKRFGQHYLIDEGVLQRIADAVGLQRDQRVLEIGPGPGALTDYLFGQSGEYVAVELDRDLVPLLKARFPGLTVINEDILRVDLDSLLVPAGWRIVGNLPYNISSPLLIKLFGHLDRIKDMHFMFQRELGARLSASPGTKSWGRLGVVTQYHCHVETLFEVLPEAFSPPPRVHSQVVRLRPRSERQVVNAAGFNKVLQLAFSARRKRIANGLKSLEVDWERAGVDQGLRPDALSVDDFVNLTNAVSWEEE